MWKRWKLVRDGGIPIKDYIGQNGLRLKNGRVLDLKGLKYSFALLENGAVMVLWEQDGLQFHEVISHSGWDVKIV